MLDSISLADHARFSRLAALAVCAAAILACLWLVVRLAWLLVPQGDVATSSVPVVAPTQTTPVQSVAKWHLFGNNQSIAVLRSQNAPATLLKLTLRGTLAMDNAQDGIAMIEDEHGAERAYKVGERVGDGARLAQVYADHVVLDHAGVAETLNLPQSERRVPAPPAPNQANLATATPTRASSLPPNYLPPQLGNGVDWSAAQKKLQLDPAQLAQQVRVEPVFVGGKIAGARLSGGGEVGKLMAQAGLKSTDLVTAVNGQSLSSVTDPQQLMDNLKNAGSLSVTVLRDGKPATLTLNLR